MLKPIFYRRERPFHSVIAAGPTVGARIAFLRRSIQRNTAIAAVLAVVLHGLTGIALREVQLWPEADEPIGLRGAIKVVNIEPFEPKIVDQERLAQQRRATGALVALEFETQPDPVPQPERVEPPPPVPLLVFEAPPPITAPPSEPIRIELREDFTVDLTSPDAARSEDFNPVRLVLPEYPDRAFDNDVQGVVRLEAKVGISGRVLDVWVLESPDPDLSLAASRAMLHWEFRPYMLHGKPQQFRIVVPFRFRIID